MQRRYLASWRGVLLATAFASLIVASFSFIVAAPAPQATVTAGESSGGLGTVIGEETNPFRLKTFPRTGYQWPFATGPHYGGQDLEIVPGVLRTTVGTFDLRGARQSTLPTELTAANRFADLGVQYYVLMLDPALLGDGALDALRLSIETNGGAVLNPIPVAGFIARLTPASLAVAQSSPVVIAAQPYHPAYKLSAHIGRAQLADPFKAVSDVYDLNVRVHQGEDAGATAARLAEMGGNVVSVFGDTIRVEIHRGHLATIARLESVVSIEERLPIYPNAEETTNVMQTGRYCPRGPCGPIPYHAAGIDGGGVGDASPFRLHVLDTGFQLDNGDLSDTKTNAGSAGASHRKVQVYQSTNPFGGSGDLLGCDASSQGSFTHGHTVAATALGWATDITAAYDAGLNGFTAPDPSPDTSKRWKLDGVAPRARLVAFDAQVTPNLVSCGDPSADGIFPGDLYGADLNSNSALAVAYTTHGALDHNFSWGNTNSPVYGGNATDIDAFLNDARNAMVFVSAGNEGADDDGNLVPDLATVSNPASCKNCLSIGSTGNANDLGTGTQDQNDRSFFSSKGPATENYTSLGCPACTLDAGGGRIAPILMAPGQERGNMGVDSEFNCRSLDNDQTNPVECDIVSGVAGTSFSSPAAAGSAILVRDYFAQGFYPSSAAVPGDQVASISGALLKAILIDSADWVGEGNTPGTNNLMLYRANVEQGYGRIQLDNVLPLQNGGWGPIGLIVADESGFTANNTTLSGQANNGVTESTTFTVSDVTQELRIALAWTEGAGEFIVNNLDLEVEAPDGTIYYGNYFTEDWNRNNSLDAGEDCPGFDGSTGVLDQFPWSLPKCANSKRDIDNVSEAVMLSPDPDDNGNAEDGLSQIQPGDWIVRVIGTSVTGQQPYAVAIAGGVAVTSSVRFTNGAPVCNDIIGVTVNETDEANDLGANLTPGEIASRITVQVLDGLTVIDTEPGTAFTWSRPEPLALRFIAEDVVLSDGTAPDPGNGVLDIGDGNTLRVVYADEANGAPDPAQERISTATVDCSAAIGFGNLVFGSFGRDTLTFVDGGCERNGRDSFEFGFPDAYIDNDEQVAFGLAFFNDDARTLTAAIADLRCVLPDGDSPATCQPGSTDCADPNRLNNPLCTGISILDTPKLVGDIPAGSAIAAIFTIKATSVAPNTNVEMIVGVSSPTSGKSAAGYAISRQTLEADEQVFYYSTDYPTGGTEFRDYNNSETMEITESAQDFFSDYRFEERTWSNATATGKNGSLQSPWNFDTNNGGFVSGIGATSTADLGVGNIVANWGEDKNFNASLDAGEDRDTVNTLLDQNWMSTATGGGCGWQSGSTSAGGVWHTGTIRTPSSGGGKTCMFNAAANGKCQNYEIINGTTGVKTWFEILLTPVVEQVNAGYRLEHINWAWNLNSEMTDQFATFTWELDTDTTKGEPVDLTADLNIFNAFSGPSGPIDNQQNPGLYRPNVFGVSSTGFSMFAPSNANGSGPGNGTAGNNRVGDWSCFFDSKGLETRTLGPAGPPDDDIDNDSDGTIDEYVAQNGPIRNFDLTVFNGPDMRFSTLEDIYGPSGATFQGALGFFVAEDNDGATAPNPAPGYGVAFDDMVMEWKEINVIPDGTDCASGQCATLNLDVSNFYEGSAILNVTLTEASPDAANDCDLDGFPDGTRDCDGNGADDIPVEVYNDLRQDTEIIFLNELTPAGGVYRGQVAISAVADVDALAPWNPADKPAYAPGTLFVQRTGTDLPSVSVDYQDDDDGTGSVCNNDIDPAGRGLVTAGTGVIFPVGRLSVASVRLTDNGDGDGIADTNETINVFVTLNNNSGADLKNVVARIATNDTKIDCVTQSTINIGDMTDGEVREGASAFVMKVSPTANRGLTFDDFSAKFTVSLSSDEFAATFAPETFTLDLDLNVASNGGTPGQFFEDFESSNTTFGLFTSMTLDASAKGTNANSDGYRCQFNDPDFINANSYGNTQCGLEHLAFQPLIFDWHNHSSAVAASAPDGGRAFSGSNSLHFGSHNGNPDDDTTSFGQLDAVRTSSPIHLSRTLASELTFKTQISVVDDRTVNAPGGETPDKAIVMIRQADNGGTGIGDWIKIKPYSNVYDRQGTDNFFECMFDPIDDGSTEDDFFDPLDPDRRLGPSSTCYPEFVFAFLGDTDYRNSFNISAIGRASDGPGLQGNIDRGTWVEPKFNLAQYLGRSIFVRFLYTTIQVQRGILTVEQLFDLPNGWPGDDGAYFDDVRITNTVSIANTISADGTNNSGLVGADCNANCTTLTATIASDRPGDTTPAPGHVIELTAFDTAANTCVDGVLQYQWWLDDGDGDLTTGPDTLLRDYTDNPVYASAPSVSGKYAVRARCSSAPNCGVVAGTNVAFLDVTVDCPASGNLGFAQAIGFNTKTQFGWATTATVDAVRGNLNTLRTSATYTGALEACVANDVNTNLINDASSPASGNGLFWLVKGSGGGGGACNAVSTYGSASRDSQIALDGNACP